MQESRSQIVMWTVMRNSDSEFFVSLGKRIAKRRKALRMTQAELGELLQVTQQQVASYEKGEKRIPVSRIPRLAECLSVDMRELVVGQGSASGKRGPSPKIQRQLEQIRQLPKSEQQFVSKLLENVLEKAAAGAH